MTDPYESPGRYMHEESAYEFCSSNSKRFPSTFVLVVFHIVCDIVAIDGEQSVVADCYAMGVLAKILNN